MPTPLSATPSQSTCAVRRQVRHQPEREHQADQADRDVDEEDPLPAEGVDEHAAEDGTDQGGDAGRRAPQRHGLAAPVAGKIRVMTAIVCGVISAAPTPCTTRATISISTVVVKPHHSEARVKTVRPTM